MKVKLCCVNRRLMQHFANDAMHAGLLRPARCIGNVREAVAAHTITCRACSSAHCIATVCAPESLTMDVASCSCTLYCSAHDKPWWVCAPADDTGDARAWTDAGTFVMVDSDLDDGCAFLGRVCIENKPVLARLYPQS